MKVLGAIACMLCMWGLIWGIFLPKFIWVCAVGLLLMMFCLVFGDDE